MKKITLLLLLFSFYYSIANDSTKVQPKGYHFFSILPSRLIVGEAILFYEYVNKKNKGIEIGLGYIYPLKNQPLYSYTFNSGNYSLFGYSLCLSKKFYNKKRTFSYFAPEIIIKYGSNDNIPVQWKMYSYYEDYASQKRTTFTVSGKFGWRTKRGILDFYLGIGAKVRYVKTTYTTLYPQAHYPGYVKLIDDNGWYFYPVPRIGLKLGFGIRKRKDIDNTTN